MPVKVGFIGAGHVANIHRTSLQECSEHIDWAGVYDLDVDLAEQFSQLTGAPVCRSEKELLDTCQAVYICTWTSAHLHTVHAAAERGLAVYCEKPLSVSLAHATQMVEAVLGAGIVHQAGLVLRHSPAFHWLRHLMTDQQSGNLISITLRDDQYLPVKGYYGSTWRTDLTKAGSGVLLEHSIHDVDILEFLAGPVESVSCETAAVHDLPGIEDVANVTIRFQSGVPGGLTTVWHDILERANERRVEVFSEHLWAVLDGHYRWGPVYWQREGQPFQSVQGRDLLPIAKTVGLTNPNPDLAFLLAVETGTSAHPDFITALRAHQVVDAAYRSAQTGMAISVRG